MNKFQISNLKFQNVNGITRRGFLGFFLLGGIISLLGKKVKGVVGIEDGPRKAMFWRKADES